MLFTGLELYIYISAVWWKYAHILGYITYLKNVTVTREHENLYFGDILLPNVEGPSHHGSTPM